MSRESKHTREPWTIADEGDNALIRGADGKPVASRVRPEPRRPDDERDANTLRVVATINACAGVDTLWPGMVAELVASFRRCLDAMESISGNYDTNGDFFASMDSGLNLLSRLTPTEDSDHVAE